MRFRPFEITYQAEDGQTVVYLHGRDKSGVQHTVAVEGVEPYFYCKTGAADELDSDKIVRIDKEAGKCFLSGKKLDRVVTRYPFDVPKLRTDVGESWEADVLFENRVRYDLHIVGDVVVPDGCDRLHRRDLKAVRSPRPGKAGVRKGGTLHKRTGPRWAAYDIETWDKGGFHGAEDPRAPIVSIAAWDSYSNRYVCIFGGVLRQAHRDAVTRRFKEEGWKVQVVEVIGEENLFKTFNAWLKQVKPDLLLGWNNSEYDDKYLINRARRIGADEPAFKGIVLFDAEDGFVFSKYQRPPSSALHYVATEYFGLPGKSTDKRIWEMMDGPRDELVYYNVTDVFDTKEIVLQSGILDFYLRLAERAGTGIGRCFSTGHLVDSMVFHELSGSGLCQPTKKKLTKKEKEAWGKIKGAEVFDPFSGIAENVVELDNGSEYPCIMRTFNFSPETFIPPEKWAAIEKKSIPYVTTINGNRYRLDKQGVFPKLLTELQGDRDAAKAVKDKIGDDVNKKLMNTFYGVTPSPTYRMPNRALGADITGMSAEHLRWNKKVAEGWHRPATVLYGDTDSNLLTFKSGPTYEDANKWGGELADDLNATFLDFARQFGPIDTCYLNVKFENGKVYDKFLQAGTKKKYVALYRDKNGDLERDGLTYSMKWRGFEMRRGDAAQATKDSQDKILTEMLFGASRGKIIQLVSDTVAFWRSAAEKSPQDLWRLGKPKIVSKAQQVLKACRYSNSYLGTEFRKGDKPAMFYGYVAGHPKVDVFLWPWRESLPAGAQLNVESTIEAVVLSPLEGALDLLDLRPSDCKNPVEVVGDWI